MDNSTSGSDSFSTGGDSLPLGLAGLPEALRLLRERRGLRQKDLAVILRNQYGIASYSSTISKYENGAMIPGIHVVASILSALDYRFSDLEELLDHLAAPDRTEPLPPPTLKEQSDFLKALLAMCQKVTARIGDSYHPAEEGTDP